ncbi:hypothetical protein [Fastidiosibacter lacustris]|uniref:hypothetical protein n=1 Tax=Fastidiosibacter lacustris TaxID=2056695 RepID=UPI0013004543|nr:hypothetical protein [Fastidiosibacter lacustris]
MKKTKESKEKIRFRRTKKMFLIDSFQKQHKFIANIFKQVFKIRQPEHEMSYEDLAAIGVDSNRVTYLIRRFTFMLRLCLLLAVVDYFYALYLFIHGYILVGLMAISVLLLLLANAFKYHFWRYQLLKKKLGCHFKEWFSDLVKGVK